MNAPLYNTEILRLAASTPSQRLADPMASVEKRSPICGSRVTVDIDLDAAGCVTGVGILARACALGQASSSLFAAQAVGRSVADLAMARDQLARWLAGEGPVPDWPGIDVFTPAIAHNARHPSIRLAFEAGAEAAATALARQQAAA
ncbi:MAG: iron-sulfur cluster assembly scaffold protein [Sphingomonas sp.]|jgi:NifU-like protein involved in Fe-S cluster formation